MPNLSCRFSVLFLKPPMKECQELPQVAYSNISSSYTAYSFYLTQTTLLQFSPDFSLFP